MTRSRPPRGQGWPGSFCLCLRPNPQGPGCPVLPPGPALPRWAVARWVEGPSCPLLPGAAQREGVPCSDPQWAWVPR